MQERYVVDLLGRPEDSIQSRIPDLIGRVAAEVPAQLCHLLDALPPPQNTDLISAISDITIESMQQVEAIDPMLSSTLLEALSRYRAKCSQNSDAIGLVATLEQRIRRGDVTTALEVIKVLRSRGYDIMWSKPVNHVWRLQLDEEDEAVIVSEAGNGVRRFRYKDGEEIARINPAAGYRDAMWLDKTSGNLLIGTDTGSIECFNRSGGRLSATDLGQGVIECMTKVSRFVAVGWAAAGISVHPMDNWKVAKEVTGEEGDCGHPNCLVSIPDPNSGLFCALFDYNTVASFTVLDDGSVVVGRSWELGEEISGVVHRITLAGEKLYAVALDGRVFLLREWEEWVECGRIGSEPFFMSKELYEDLHWLVLGTRDGKIFAFNEEGQKRVAFPKIHHALSNGVCLMINGERWLIGVEGHWLRAFREVDNDYLGNREKSAYIIGRKDKEYSLNPDLFAPNQMPCDNQAKVDREEYLDALKNRMIERETAIVHLWGLSGSGKSTVVNEFSDTMTANNWATTIVSFQTAKNLAVEKLLCDWLISQMSQMLPQGISGLRGGLARDRASGIRAFIENAAVSAKRAGRHGVLVVFDDLDMIPPKLRI